MNKYKSGLIKNLNGFSKQGATRPIATMHGTSNVHRIENFIKKKQPRMAFELCDAILGNAGLEKQSQIELLTLRAKCQMDLKRFYESRVDLEKARSLNQFNEKVILLLAEVTSRLRLHREACTMLKPLLVMKDERAMELQKWLIFRARQSAGDYGGSAELPDADLEEFIGPINIAPSRVRGRQLVVTKDIKPDEILWTESSIVELNIETDDPDQHKQILHEKINKIQENDPIKLRKLHSLYQGSIIRPPSMALFKTNYYNVSNLPKMLNTEQIDNILEFNINALDVHDEISDDPRVVIGIWSLMSMLNHGPPCVMFDYWRGLLVARSVKYIKKGTPLTLPFVDPNLAEEQQREILEEKHQIFI